jgi:hypothetical protein
MQRYANDTQIERKGKIGKYLTIGGLAVMAIGLYLSIQQPEQVQLVLGFALVGILTSQVGTTLFTRWGRSPRMDELIDGGLKGLDSNYSIVHYELGANHTLITPTGVYALVPSPDKGKISFDDGKWYQTLRRAGRDRKKQLRRIAPELSTELKALQTAVSKALPEVETPEVGAIVLFLHQDADVDAANAPAPAIHVKKLKTFLRKLPKLQPLGKDQLEQVLAAINVV